MGRPLLLLKQVDYMKHCTEGGSVHTYDESDTCFDCGNINSTPRVLKTREKAAKLGRNRKEYLVTDSEHVKLKALLSKLREVK